jgi:diaminopimelate epimerase
MKLHFHKYQATGNDFILIDNRLGKISLSAEQVKRLCDRRFGVGADGVMLVEEHPSLAFNLEYYNSDGSQSLCGNGSRAAVQFASTLGMLNGSTSFLAFDGAHDAELLPSGIVRLRMNEVREVKKTGDDFFIHTGSPHYIRFVNKVSDYPVIEEGRKIRYSEAFAKQGGTNVNFAELLGNNTIFVRTYERGVEDETLSCGTGVTAAALASAFHACKSPVVVNTRGGNLTVEFNHSPQKNEFTHIYLVGPARKVFEGDLEL